MENKDMIDWIDNASYEDLLIRWRFGQVGMGWFTGEVGEHYAETILKKRREIGAEKAAAISRQVGW